MRYERDYIVDDLLWFQEWMDALEIDIPFNYNDEESREEMRELINKRIDEFGASFKPPTYQLVMEKK